MEKTEINNACLVSFECSMEDCQYKTPCVDGSGCRYQDTFVSMRHPYGCDSPEARKDALHHELLQIETEQKKKEVD